MYLWKQIYESTISYVATSGGIPCVVLGTLVTCVC
jgi:hypothetical protein